MAKTPSERTFGVALLQARATLRVDRGTIAHECRVLPRTLHRWEADESWPNLETRHVLLNLLCRSGLGHAELQELATLALTTLVKAGIREVPAPSAAGAPSSVAAPVQANAQKAIDDAIREAAEDLAVHARDLRPVASRLLDAVARSGVAADVAARMVLGVPKRPSRSESPSPVGAKEEPKVAS